MKSNIEMMAEILPSIRAEIAKELISSYNLNQGDVSRLLGVSQPAVSQYVRQIRGNRIMRREHPRKEIAIICQKLAKGDMGIADLEREMYNLCRMALEHK